MRKVRVVQGLAVVVLLVITVLAPGGQESRGNQQGPGVNERTGNIIGLCRLNFGIEDVTTVRTPASGLVGTKVLCIGGPLDGLKCLISKDATICDWSTVGTRSSGTQHVVTNVQDLTFATDLATDPVTPLTASVAREPMLVEAVITWDPSSETGDQTAMAQVNACRHLGGTELVATTGSDAAVSSYTVGCDGGLLEGLWCAMGTGLTTCFFEPATTQDAAATESPAETPTEAPPPPTMPTEAPTEEPTVTPTDAVPTEAPTLAPTDEPVIEPTFADPAGGNPWTLPEGTLAPIEQVPTPKEGPLT